MEKKLWNLEIGNFKKGKRNSITDVKGVKVGHVTYDEGDKKTGVTAIIPHGGNIFQEKLVSAAHVINGFGKSVGLVQIEELGTLETPIILTNTLAVGKVADGLVSYMLDNNSDIGDTTGTVNPVVCECNDGYLNDIRNLFLGKEDVYNAIKNAGKDFEEGAVGAGTGMVCYNLKGGIGSSSRIVEIEGEEFVIGALTLTNFGRLKNLVIDNNPVGEIIAKIKSQEETLDKGSIIVIIATDLPLSHRQLKRILKRVQSGIARTGSFVSNGSGEIAIGFSTANRINHYGGSKLDIRSYDEKDIDRIFEVTVLATEEAILQSMYNGKTTIGRKERKIESIREYDNLWSK